MAQKLITVKIYTKHKKTTTLHNGPRHTQRISSIVCNFLAPQPSPSQLKQGGLYHLPWSFKGGGLLQFFTVGRQLWAPRPPQLAFNAIISSLWEILSLCHCCTALLLRFHSNTRSGDFHFFFYLHPAVANSFLFRNLSHHPADPFLCSSCDFSRMSFARKCTPFPHCSFIHRRMTRSCSRTVEERVAAVAVVAVGGGATSSQVCPLLDISVAALASACRLWRCW